MRKLLNQIITLPALFIIFSIGMSNFANADDFQMEKRAIAMTIIKMKS